jgi:hypothetical protein
MVARPACVPARVMGGAGSVPPGRRWVSATTPATTRPGNFGMSSPEHDVAVAHSLGCQRAAAGPAPFEQRGAQALHLQRRERLELHCADLARDAFDHHPVAHPRGLPHTRLDRFQPVRQELRHGDPAPGHCGAGVGSRRQVAQGSLGCLLRREPDRWAWRRAPDAGSGPTSTTNDHTFPFRFTEPVAMNASVGRGCHGL